MDDRYGGVPHVARFIQGRIEHQRDRQTNWTQPGDGAEVFEFSSPTFAPEEIQDRGFTGKYTIVKDFVHEVRPKIGIPAIYRYETKPGVQAQVDWAECGYIEIDGEKRKLYCFTIVLGYS